MGIRAGIHAVCLVTVAAAVPTAAEVPACDPFTVNTTTAGLQVGPDVAVAHDDRFAVVWEAENQDGDGWGVFARWFEWNGAAVTGEVQVNSNTAGGQTLPRIDRDGQGNFVIVWDDSILGIRARRFDSAGSALGDELEVTGPESTPHHQALAVNAGGSFVVTWLAVDTPNRILEARRFGADGAPLGDPIVVSTFSSDPYYDGTAVELLDDQSFLTAWSDGEEVYGRLYDTVGSPVGSQFQVSQLGYPSLHSFSVDVGSEDSGQYRIVWSNDINLEEIDTLTRTVTGAGDLGGLINLDLPSLSGSGFSMAGDGEFIVTRVWAFPDELEGTRYSANCGVLSQFTVASVASYIDTCCTEVAHHGADGSEFVVVWAEGYYYDIRARSFLAGRIFSDGFETGNTSAWSGTEP